MKFNFKNYMQLNHPEMLRSAILLLVFLVPFMMVVLPAYGAIIFQDNFDSQSSNANAGGTEPSGWAQWYAAGGTSATEDGVTHYSGEISSPGRGGNGKSLKMWRYNCHFGDYTGALLYYFPSSSRYSHWYMSYWWKIPTAFNCSDQAFKLWRYNTSSGGGEIYLNFTGGNGNMRTSGQLAIYDGGPWETILNNAEVQKIWDGNWHMFEWEFDLANRTLRLWVDGVQKYSNTNYSWRATGHATGIQHFSIGNTYTHGGMWQNSWQAMEFDDFTLSTTYIGFGGATLEPPTDATPPPIPPPSGTTPPAEIRTIFSEAFDDNNFSSRGWFDDTSISLDTNVKYAGTSSLKLTWSQTGTAPGQIGAMRKSFSATDELYISMYWRFNSDWVGSGQSYHPHLVYLLSDLDDEWGGLAYNYLDTYIEVNNLTPRMVIQDGMNVSTIYGGIPNDITRITENRDVSGCNGSLSGSDSGSASCYSVGGGVYWNGRMWDGTQDFSLNKWYKVEAYLKMNSISSNHAVADGIMQMWINGTQVINNSKVVYRTNQHPTMKWGTMVIAPWIGDGSPREQTMWIDELTIANGTTESGGLAVPSNLRITP